MKIVKTEGIVVGDTNYSESSKILNIFTKDLGLISVMSKGCRNIKSKLRGVSNKFSYCSYDISYKESGISTLMDGSVINTHMNILTDIVKTTYLSYIIDLTLQVYKHSKSNDIYNLLISTINKLNDNCDPIILLYILELKYLDFLGIKPNFNECSICGSTKNILTISVSDGGYICSNCYKDGKIYSNTIIKLVRLLSDVDIDSISKISIKDENKHELDLFITDYYESLTGIYLKNKDFIKKLKIFEEKK